MTHPPAQLLVWLGALGFVEFGGFWLASQYVGAKLQQTGRLPLHAIVGHRHWRRIHRWVHVAPVLAVASVAALLAGSIMYGVGAS